MGSLSQSLSGAGSAVAAPTVNAGADASFDLLSALPYTLGGSGTGTGTTFKWTKVAGTPVPTFADDTSPTSTAIYDADGAVTLRLTATNAGGIATDDVVITVTATLAALLTRMASGSRVANWSEVDVSSETFNGGNFSQLNDSGAGGFHLTQATSANQPAYRANTGPSGKSYLETGGTALRLSNSSIALASGKALWLGAVCKSITPPATSISTFAARDLNSEVLGEGVANFGTEDATHFRATAKTAGAVSREAITITNPAYDTTWRLWDLKFAAAVVPVLKCNNAATSPAFTVAGLATAVEGLAWGSAGSTTPSKGGIYLSWLFESVGTSAGSACLSEESAVRYYVRKQTGLG